LNHTVPMIERYFYVENHRTGARACIPIEKGKIDFYREHRDVPVEEYVRRAKVPLSEISEWNGRDHCIFGMWESIRQDGTWGPIYRAINAGSPRESIEIGIEHGS